MTLEDRVLPLPVDEALPPLDEPEDDAPDDDEGSDTLPEDDPDTEPSPPEESEGL